MSPISPTYSDTCSKPRHNSAKLDLFCNKCKESVCKQCWKSDHSDKKKHEIVPFSVLLKPEKNIETRIGLYKTECSQIKTLESEYKFIQEDIEKLREKQKEITETFVLSDLRKSSTEVKLAMQKNVDAVIKLKAKIGAQFDKITEKHGQIFEDHRKQAVLEETSLVPNDTGENEDNSAVGDEESDNELPGKLTKILPKLITYKF